MNGAFMFGVGHCYGCGYVFTFNPHKVPSIRDQHNVQHPVCRQCMDRANAARVDMGMDPHFIHKDAYVPSPEYADIPVYAEQQEAIARKEQKEVQGGHHTQT